MGMLGKGVGVLAKGIGSGSPSFVLEDRDPDLPPQQFDVTVEKDENGTWLGIHPGETVFNYYVIGITSSGNRDISAGFQELDGADDFGTVRRQYHATVNCYKALQFPGLANELTIGQRYQAEAEGLTYVVMIHAIPSGAPPRLCVIGKQAFQDKFLYGCSDPTSDFGKTAVLQSKTCSSINATTATILGNVVLVEPTTVGSDSKTYWERMGLIAKLIAVYDPATDELTQAFNGPMCFDGVSEHYSISVATTIQVNTPPSIIDGGWASAFYTTAAANAPTGYTFDYTY
jgi:hypothetical protein